MKRLLSIACGLSLAFLGAGLASATSITTPGLTVSSGSLTFSNFTCDFTSSGMFTGSCSTISATPIAAPPAGINFAMNLTTLNASSADAALTFNVASTTGITNVGLTFSTQIAGLAVTSVTESVYTSLGGTLVGYADVSCQTNPCNVATLTDNISLGGSYTNLYIIKDISLSGYATGAYSTTSFVQQTYTTATPEPVSLSLIGGGLAVLGLVRLRKNKA